ncbi:MAG: YcbK family protein [Hyphomicrobiales bacterium]|nr:YcbK family protein [Hyphomicrobiales bacterium]
MFGVLFSSGTENAIANGDTRTLHLVNAHTHEAIDATYMVNGRYDPAVLAKLNWFLRDWRQKQEIQMDPHLFDIVWDAYRLSGSHEPIVVLCGYRSPKTNAMLRRRSRLVAKHSQHILGKAMDQHYVDVPMSKIREIGMKLQMGGVGYYPHSGTPFVHLDAGPVRYWPRMSRAQLVRMFPDGKTVDIPSDGVPLKGYEEARAEIAARGWHNAPVTAVGKPKGFFARLFGGDSGDDAEAGQQAQLAKAWPSDDDMRFYRPNPGQVKAPAATPVAKPKAVSPAPAAAAPSRPLPTLMASNTAAPSPAANVPLPPQRPADLSASLQLAEVPLPPQRPVQLASLDKSYVPAPAAHDTGKPTVLPDIITHGTGTAAQADATSDGSALAYADSTSLFGAARISQNHNAAAARHAQPPQMKLRPALRMAQAKVVVASTATASLAWHGEGNSLRGHVYHSGSVTGMIAPPLRASQSGLAGLLFGPPGVPSSFVEAQANLPSDHFSK